MKVISERISILKTDKVLSIVILPTTDKNKLRLLFLWLMAWTVCGLIVFGNYFQIKDPNAKLYIIVYLSFWAYFEFNIVRAFIWKKFGKEKIWIQGGSLYYQREINKKGKIQEFQLNLISPVQLIELKASRFSDIVNQSFWVKGGERLELYAQAKVLRFGMQITDSEALAVTKELNPLIP